MSERLISQLAHVELLTPTVEESLQFFTDVMGLEESSRDADSVYLRCWGDYFHHSVQLTEAPKPGLGHAAWRAEGPEQLERAVATLEQSGLGEGWSEGQTGHGRAYRYRGPGGHLHEIFWDVERYQPPPDKTSQFPARPQRFAPTRRRSPAARPCHRHDPRPDERRRVVPRHPRLPLHGIHAAERRLRHRHLHDGDDQREVARPGSRRRLLGHPRLDSTTWRSGLTPSRTSFEQPTR